MQRRFTTLDVFTAERFASNPLAVVHESDGLDGERMQAIAREFGLPETVFIHPPADAAHTAHLRIFTPAAELPFAGHPTVGTAALLALMNKHRAPARLILEEQIGAVHCDAATRGDELAHARFKLPILPRNIAWKANPCAVAAAFAGLLAARGNFSSGTHKIAIEQGYEMGRPSVIHLEMQIDGGELATASIAGDAVIVTEGTLHT